MSNELIPQGDFPVSKYTDDDFDKIASVSDFLPRLQLCTSNSEAVKQGLIPVAHYAVIRGEVADDLGKEVDIIPLEWRPLALDMSNKEKIISVYDLKDPEFKRIQDQSAIANSQCMFGPQFLCWIPTILEFVTFYLGSKTARRQGVALRGLLGRLTTLKSEYIKTASYSWHGPVVTASTGVVSNIPPTEELKEEILKFQNPKINTSPNVEGIPQVPSDGRS